jgi:aspartyl-tRNA synthetase
MHAYRSHTCAGLNTSHVGQSVRLSGWVHRVRDHGGILFIDLRDHYGITQILADPDSPAFADIEKVRSEWVIRIDGEVKARDAALVNPKLATGEIEIFIREIEVLGAAAKMFSPGDIVIFMNFAFYTPEEMATHKPKVVVPDADNKIERIL